MRIVAIIPARGGSKGIVGKNSKIILNKPLIAWSIEQALSAKQINEVYVTSDSDEILNISKEYGATSIKRPDELASDTSSSEDALKHALTKIDQSNPIDYVMFLQATSPLRLPHHLDQAIDHLVSKDADSLLSVTPHLDHFYWQRDAKDGQLKSVNYDYKARKPRQQFNETYHENGSFYLFKPKILINENNRLGGKIEMYQMDTWCSFQIDELEDFNTCEYLLKRIVGENV
ncbi:hypothetical protein BVY03_03315 [bacterium K02(2017)]|nr:hypothetical protein BVY03_03315 [bacterium K02(2017)]